jgi:hypothetical protein
VTITIQSLDADLVSLGDLGVSRLYGQYDDYQSVGIDFGLRRYTNVAPALQAYAEGALGIAIGALGIAIVDERDVVLVAPQVNLTANATDFYDRIPFLFGDQARF